MLASLKEITMSLMDVLDVVDDADPFLPPQFIAAFWCGSGDPVQMVYNALDPINQPLTVFFFVEGCQLLLQTFCNMPNIHLVCSVWHILPNPFLHLKMLVCYMYELADFNGVLL